MTPDKVEDVILYYSSLMKGKDIEFSKLSFENISPSNLKDVVYLDPPYTNTKALYHGNIDFDGLQDWISKLTCSWFMNLNGVNGKDNEESIKVIYTGKEVLVSGKSSFSRMKGKDVKVGEYFYYKLV